MKKLLPILLLWAGFAQADVVCSGTANSCGGSTEVSNGGTAMTSGTVPKATGANTLGNSTITDDGTTVTVNTATAFKATAPQNGAVGLINVVGTLTPNGTGNPTGLRLIWTGSGSSAGAPQGFVNFIAAGYTGSSQTILNYFENDSAGTNTTFMGGNNVISGSAVGVGAGHNYGAVITVNGSTSLNAPFVGLANGSGNGSHVGGTFLATNGGAGAKVGVYGALKATIPTYVNAAAQFDNAAIAAPILVAQDNGAAVPSTGATSAIVVTDGANLQIGNAVLTNATMAAETQGLAKTVTSSYTWTNAQVVALGATTAGDITVATLPAKTQVVDCIVVITGQGAGTTTLTVSVGDAVGGTPFINYTVASDAKAAANTVYGDALAERGTSIDTEFYNLPSYTATTLVTAHFISTGANLSAVTGSTGRVILTTRQLP